MSKPGQQWLSIAFLFVLPGAASADGVFVWDRGVDLEEPTQKAVILHTDGVEDLILQADYAGEASDFAWVVPLPTTPEVNSVGEDVFEELSEYTQLRGRHGYRGEAAVSESGGAVQTLERKRLGIYDVAVLVAQEGSTLVEWLRQNGFQLPPEGLDVVEDYVRRGWVFTAVRVLPGEGQAGTGESPSEQTLMPLKFTFPSREIVYPLKISSLNKGETEILIYVLNDDVVIHPSFACQAPNTGPFLELLRSTSDEDTRRRLTRSFEPDHCFYRAVSGERLPKCAQALPRMDGKTFLVSRLRQTFQTSQMSDDLVLRRPEELGPTEKRLFIARTMGSDGPLDASSALLLRMGEEVCTHICEALEGGTPVGGGAYQLLAYRPSEGAMETLERFAARAAPREREAMAAGLRDVPNPKSIPVLRRLCQNLDSPNACEALGEIGTDEAIAVLCELARAENRSARFTDSNAKTRANHTRRAALHALSKLARPELIRIYAYAFEHGRLTQDEVLFCLRGLERIDSPAAYPIVERILRNSQNERNRKAAEELLARWKHETGGDAMESVR